MYLEDKQKSRCSRRLQKKSMNRAKTYFFFCMRPTFEHAGERLNGRKILAVLLHDTVATKKFRLERESNP